MTYFQPSDKVTGRKVGRALKVLFEPLPLVIGGHPTLMGLKSNSCRWIDGAVNGLETIFCGKTTSHGKSYCHEHHRLTVVPKIQKVTK